MTFAAGVTARPVLVDINDNLISNADRTFFLFLNSSDIDVIAVNSLRVVIQDNDGEVGLRGLTCFTLNIHGLDTG